MESRLYRSRHYAILGGVCGGLGEYLRLNPTYIRLFFVLLAFGNGIGILIYLLLWFIIPLQGQRRKVTLEDTVIMSSLEIADRTRAVGEDLHQMVHRPGSRLWLALGSGLILIGVVFLLENFHIPWLSWFDFDMIWPVLLILGGLVLLLRRERHRQ